MIEDSGSALETPEDAGPGERGVVKRWELELRLADKRESEWRKKGEKVYQRYRSKDARKHSFNILWSNTETLAPAVYNSLPSPDVRRRFKDEDPIGKAVAEVLCRSLEYGLDTTDFDHQIKQTVLDMLLPGRGVARVRYVPSFTQVGVTEQTHVEENETHPDAAGEALEGDTEELEWEQTPIEHVQWDDFRCGPGKEWSEVPWEAFRHRLTRKELVEQFPDCGEDVPLDDTQDEEVKKEQDSEVAEMFKTAEVWEIWDKEKLEVVFISKGYKERPLKTVPDPLGLQGFFPNPRPLYAIADAETLTPVPLFELYREQADELDTVTRRINILIKGLKMRGIYDSTLSELSELMRGEDNDLIPAANVTALIERGGLEKAIWFMPIEQAAKVLQILVQQREQTKQVIYEITGISDILRGSTNANETATAQQIKASWGSSRLKKMQGDVARFIRDIIRIQAEIIGEKFQPETFATMTGLKFPTMAEKQQAMMQWQQQAFMAQQQGQNPPPQPKLPPSWEEIIQIMRDDKLRTFKVDVETDSTVAASLETDMKGLQEVLGGVAQVMQSFGPAVQMGALPIDALKEILMTVTRRAKLGNAVEDALDKMQQPKPQQPEQDNSMQVEQIKQQGEAARFQAEQQATAAQEQAQQQHELQLESIKQQEETRRREMELAADADIKWRIARLDAETKVIVADIGARQKAQADMLAAEQESQRMQAEAENKAIEQETKAHEKAEGEAKNADMQNTLTTAMQQFQQAVERLSQPRTVIRGVDGRISGVQ